MPAPTKPVPWNEIKGRYEAGEAESAIAEDLTARGQKISKQGIAKRRRKEGWVRAALPERARHSREVAPAEGGSAALLEEIANGLPASLAAKKLGISPDTLKQWREYDPEFARQVSQVEATWAGSRVSNIMAAGDRGDWKADQYLLGVHPATKEEFGEPRKGRSTGIVVNFLANFQRGAPPNEADIIEIDPEEAKAY